MRALLPEARRAAITAPSTAFAVAASVILLTWGACPLLAADPGGELPPQAAPVNPDFTEYMNRFGVQGAPHVTAAGYGLGERPSPVDLSHLGEWAMSTGPTLASTPSTYDLRSLGKLTPIRNQGAYGTCWAHATYSSMESHLLPSATSDFSENNLANLHGFDWGFDDGGNLNISIAYLSRWAGPVNETADPYPNPGGSPSGLPLERHVQQVLILPPKASSTDNALIKQAVMDYGAVYANYYHDDSCYNATYKSYYYTSSELSNHAVAIVGWDDNYPASQFNSVPAGNGAYLVRNSWGTAWGDGGYFHVSYYDLRMGFRTVAVLLNAAATSNYSRVYSHDPLGWISNFGSLSTTTYWGANLFTAAASESITAVGFYAPKISTAYQVYIYKNVTAGAPRSGTLAATLAGTLAYPGYYTLPLASIVPVTAGSRFSIVARITTPSYNYPQTIEYAIAGYSSAASAAAGQSYYSSAGTTWTDLTSWNATANFCIKAYANGVSTLVVGSPFATTTPSPGSFALTNGTVVTATVTESPSTRRGDSESVTGVCTGWVGTGSAPLLGIGLSVEPFALTQDSSITWLWQTTDLVLSNRTVALTTNFWARDTITITNGFLIQPPGDVTAHAGQAIRLAPGFTAGSGSVFRAVVP